MLPPLGITWLVSEFHELLFAVRRLLLRSAHRDSDDTLPSLEVASRCTTAAFNCRCMLTEGLSKGCLFLAMDSPKYHVAYPVMHVSDGVFAGSARPVRILGHFECLRVDIAKPCLHIA